MGAVRTHSHVATTTTMMILEGNPSRYWAIYPAVLGQPYLQQQQLCFKQRQRDNILGLVFLWWGQKAKRCCSQSQASKINNPLMEHKLQV
ncbi:hypothetical protein SDJN02_23404, partial [Cucurbita argyrosperma subsp. argyrosperma]